jgi:hypothetical protein
MKRMSGRTIWMGILLAATLCIGAGCDTFTSPGKRPLSPAELKELAACLEIPLPQHLRSVQAFLWISRHGEADWSPPKLNVRIECLAKDVPLMVRKSWLAQGRKPRADFKTATFDAFVNKPWWDIGEVQATDGLYQKDLPHSRFTDDYELQAVIRLQGDRAVLYFKRAGQMEILYPRLKKAFELNPVEDRWIPRQPTREYERMWRPDKERAK